MSKASKRGAGEERPNVSCTEFRTDDSVLDKINESKELLKSIKKGRQSIGRIGHTIRHSDKLRHRIIEGKIENEGGKGRPRIKLTKNSLMMSSQ